MLIKPNSDAIIIYSLMGRTPKISIPIVKTHGPKLGTGIVARRRRPITSIGWIWQNEKKKNKKKKKWEQKEISHDYSRKEKKKKKQGIERNRVWRRWTEERLCRKSRGIKWHLIGGFETEVKEMLYMKRNEYGDGGEVQVWYK